MCRSIAFNLLQEVSFDCIARIDNVERDSAWYYIACNGCQSKVTKGPLRQCAPSVATLTLLDRSVISIYENNDQAIFVLLGDAGRELTRKNAAELVDNYFEANQELGVGHEMPPPPHPHQALIDNIGQTHKFMKVSDLNLTGKTRTITVTKFVSTKVHPPVPTPTKIPLDVDDEVAVPSASFVAGSGFNADKGNESTSNRDESQKAKCPKH
ncbi:unnamed protein product [Eruca vesicaria subsp. sativa]|uniref:Replication factor A C-terminal domain-containing protein n=1 Tax=Eruca vesicaria subsp. sativa TaxID=29727 RepID=A0ABC8M424_ERUVS|nr:unnamed protein product [Eruca vesicaria subsp. sativa]